MEKRITWLASLVAVALLAFVYAGKEARPCSGQQWEHGVYRSFAGHFLWQDDQRDIEAENVQAFANALGLRVNADGDVAETSGRDA
jgi:hypothetical protein